MKVRPAVVADVPAIHDLIKHHAERQKMILRGKDELYATLREYMVAEAQGKIVGCASVHLFWFDLAELKGLAVDPTYERRGVGRALCDACHADLKRLGVPRVFALSSSGGFFEKIGYRRVPKESLPLFIWGECTRCPSFPICNEEAYVLDLADSPAIPS